MYSDSLKNLMSHFILYTAFVINNYCLRTPMTNKHAHCPVIVYCKVCQIIKFFFIGLILTNLV